MMMIGWSLRSFMRRAAFSSCSWIFGAICDGSGVFIDRAELIPLMMIMILLLAFVSRGYYFSLRWLLLLLLLLISKVIVMWVPTTVELLPIMIISLMVWQFSPYHSNHSIGMKIPKLSNQLVPLMAVIPLMVLSKINRHHLLGHPHKITVI